MKVLKAILLSTILGSATLASAQNPSSTSRFETMDIASLTSQASQGNHHAQFFLAKRLQKGEGVQKDANRAAYWYMRAAEQNIAPAQLNLGIMYLRGEGVKADMATGRKWLESAAHLGDNRASYALAMIDERQQQLVDAYKWYDLSSRDGMLDDNIRGKAQAKIGQLALNLSSSDIEKAKNSANHWFQNQ
ncbi:sel1 repeat family protein [Moraxella bovoculi 237]|uniref:Sel1 repeat family protein n=1 Tax=Moraxella bovoculi 237 TaxID=743974 RepID=A0A066UDB0_9GAMM|nr:tetratricopeptide repeat protein [Moraxella bovoculi]KDN25095.1 sel1 repeat family protein [Moraxella bovoculi 237]